MGKYNSSEYRVKPLMRHLEKNPQDIKKLIDFLTCGFDDLGDPIEYRYADIENGKTEKGLKPTKSHLLGLVNYLSGKGAEKYSVSDDNRMKLLNADTVTRELAKSEIRKNYESLPSRAWYIFEGYTYPDIFIEGDDYIIICEGKWTEPDITTETTYLKNAYGEYRNQMIRHIQGALNYNENKKVYAFYIVDENCSYIDSLTLNSFADHIENETITLGYNEKIEVLSSYCGCLFWQKIEGALGIKFLSKEEIDASRSMHHNNPTV